MYECVADAPVSGEKTCDSTDAAKVTFCTCKADVAKCDLTPPATGKYDFETSLTEIFSDVFICRYH